MAEHRAAGLRHKIQDNNYSTDDSKIFFEWCVNKPSKTNHLWLNELNKWPMTRVKYQWFQLSADQTRDDH